MKIDEKRYWERWRIFGEEALEAQLHGIPILELELYAQAKRTASETMYLDTPLLSLCWKGKPLSDYSKEELIDIIGVLKYREEEFLREHIRQLKVLQQLRSSNKE